jgi:hypothetical protein
MNPVRVESFIFREGLSTRISNNTTKASHPT